MDFIYWRHPTPVGIKIEEVSGGEHYKGKLWRELAAQVYAENGKESYREIGHYANGAPFLHGEQCRISVTHCDGLYAVATLPATPEIDLSEYSDRGALGIDAERMDRAQVLKIRGRFLNDNELQQIDAEDVEQNILAWTLKEAAYKAALKDGLDFREDIRIERMPEFAPPTPVFDPKEYGLPPATTQMPTEMLGEVSVRIGDDNYESAQSQRVKFRAYTYRSDNCIVSVCYSPKCAKFGIS